MRVGFDLNSILTRVIPGAVVLLPVYWTSDISLLSLTNLSLTNSSVLIFVLVALIIGEGIDLARENYKPVPDTFRRILYHETGQAKFLGLTDRMRLRIGLNIPKRQSVYTETERELYYEIVLKFNLRNDYSHVRDLYQLLLSDLNDEATARTTRIQTNYIFSENISIAIAMFSLISCIGIFVSNGPEAVELVVPLLVAFLLALLFILIFDMHGRVEQTYVDKLITEYFAYRTSEKEV